MKNANEIASRQCRFLSEDHFQELYEAFTEAYSDYVIAFALTETQFRNHINLNAVDLGRTVGCIEDGKLIGFSLNGFGDWNDRSTVYDAGTGVIPTHRRQGISDALFEHMLPAFQRDGVEQFLLEVVSSNLPAVSLYEKLGFKPMRQLALLQCDEKLKPGPETPLEVLIREIHAPNWPKLKTFWDGQPSWQNAPEAIERSRPLKQFLGAFIGDVCIGYLVFSSKFGRVAQMAVDPLHRNRGVGTSLLLAMQDNLAEGYSMQVINIDKSLGTAVDFFRNHGFYERLRQYEMLKEI